MAKTSILARKADLLWAVFLAVHVVVMLNVDLYSLYPVSWRPQYMTDLRNWQLETYRDQFFISPPAWFTVYTWLELLYHMPLCLWAIPALINDDPRVPIQLLIYAMETGVTTLTCIADYNSWTVISQAEKIELHKLYGPYLAISIIMGIDMVMRLNRTVNKAAQTAAVGPKKTR